MLEFQTYGIAGTGLIDPVRQSACRCPLGVDARARRQSQRAREAAQLERLCRVMVVDVSARHVQPIADALAHLGAVHPRRLATAVRHLIGDAHRDRVQVGVEARDGRAEQQPTRERIELVVREARARLARQHDRRLVAITHHDLDPFAVLE